MKRIEVTEMDTAYRIGLFELLAAVGGFPVVYEVPDDFDVDSFHGLAAFSATSPTASLSATYPEIAAWLNSYSGNFEFYRSLQSQFQTRGTLSEKQIECVKRAIASDKARGISVDTSKVATNFSMKAGEIILVSKFIANKIAQQAGYERGHRVFEVLEVEGETPKAFRARVRLSSTRTAYCGICGRGLENAESIAAGIGPICADKTGISFSTTSLADLELKLSVTSEVTTWIPKSAIKERISRDAEKIETAPILKQA